MTNFIVETSKYSAMVLMLCYVVLNFSSNRKKKFRMESVFAFFLHFLGYLILFFKTESVDLLRLYGVQAVFFLLYQQIYLILYPKSSSLLTGNACMLLSVGFIMLARLNPARAWRQTMLVIAAAAGTLVVPWLLRKTRNWWKGVYVYGSVGLIFLALVFFFGKTEYGAKLSLEIGSFAFQPAEFVKLTLILFTASMCRQPLNIKRIIVMTAVAAAHVLLLVANRDLGGAVTLFLPYLFMLYVASGKIFYLLGGLTLGGAAGVIAYRLFPHVQKRFFAWQNPWADITGTGWQMAQSLFAIGTGGWFGLGLCQGMPGKIPVVTKDFIFAAIAEEFGGIFALGLILIFLNCVIQFLWIASLLENQWEKVLALGLGTLFGVQVFLNIAGVIGLIPSTGITLPFISYGGTSLAATFLLFGIMQYLYMRSRIAEAANSQKPEGKAKISEKR